MTKPNRHCEEVKRPKQSNLSRPCEVAQPLKQSTLSKEEIATDPSDLRNDKKTMKGKKQMNFLLGNAKLYIALSLMIILCGYFYLRLESTEAKLSQTKSELNLALQTNKENLQALMLLRSTHEDELNALIEANKAKDALNQKLQYINRYIYKEVKNGENNLTKLFNGMLDRLWDKNATASYQ